MKVEYKTVKFCECTQQQIYRELIEKQKMQIEELSCALQNLKDAVAKAEICGVPLHHLDQNIGRHFSENTRQFTVLTEARGVGNFASLVHTLTMQDYPDGVSEEMLTGWKSGIIDARKAAHNYYDMLMKIADGEK